MLQVAKPNREAMETKSDLFRERDEGPLDGEDTGVFPALLGTAHQK